MKSLCILPLVLCAAACSSAGFNRAELRSQVSEQPLTVVSEDDIQKAFQAKPQLPAPFRLAVHFVSPAPAARGIDQWQWVMEDKQRLLDTMAGLKATGVLSDAVTIDAGSVEGTDNRAVRLAAARAGADAVLIVRGSGTTDRHSNALAITYVALVTALFVPGTQTDALFMTSASLWDVRNQYLYLSSEAEGVTGQTRPSAFVNERSALAEAKADALAALAEDVSVRLAAMR